MNLTHTYQRTLKAPVSIIGVGLHSGQKAQMKILPAAAGQGIVFVRADLPNSPAIPALHRNIVCTQMATTLGAGQAKISTVEHLMAAFAGLGIDNATVEVDGPEVPILDGSSKPFFDAMSSVGTIGQSVKRSRLVIRKAVEVRVGDKWATAEPSACLEIHGTIDWDHPAIGFQEFQYTEGESPFSDIAAARTFGFLKDYEGLKAKGLARGCNLDNVIVLDEDKVINPTGLRFADEMVRHKVLDALGDFKLAGIAIQGYFRLHRAGHDLHSQLLAAILKNPDNYEIVDQASDTEELEFAMPTRLRAAVAGYVSGF